MATMGTVMGRLKSEGAKAFRKECQRAAAALQDLQELQDAMAWECEQCGRKNDHEGSTCLGCGAWR